MTNKKSALIYLLIGFIITLALTIISTATQDIVYIIDDCIMIMATIYFGAVQLWREVK